MTTMFQQSKLLGAVLGLCMIAACSPMKDPAQAALADANSVMQKIAPDAQKYAPTEFATVQEQVAGMQTAFDKQDYQTVLNTVRKLAPSLKLVAETIGSKKREVTLALKEKWATISRDLPTSLAAVESRVSELGKSHKLPKGVSKDALAGASAVVSAVKQGLSDAQGAMAAGNLEDAVAKGTAATAQLSELMSSLAMSSSHAAAK